MSLNSNRVCIEMSTDYRCQGVLYRWSGRHLQVVRAAQVALSQVSRSSAALSQVSHSQVSPSRSLPSSGVAGAVWPCALLIVPHDLDLTVSAGPSMFLVRHDDLSRLDPFSAISRLFRLIWV